MKEFIDFLYKKKDLKFSEMAIKILKKEKITSYAFLKTTKEELHSYEMLGEPTSDLINFTKELGKHKLKVFLLYKSLKDLSEMLHKYGINSNDIKKISPFKSKSMKIDDKDEELKQYIIEIKCRMRIIGLATGSNEAVRYEYIFPILYVSIYIAKRITNKEITIDPQFEVIDKEASGQVNYIIKKIIYVVNEKLIAITKEKQKDLMAKFM